jgi:aminoglycoside 3-N-acetyltransferase
MKQNGSSVFVDGVRQWIEFEELDYNEEDFAQLGVDFAKDTGLETQGFVGKGEARLLSQPALVDYAVEWMEKNRK